MSNTWTRPADTEAFPTDRVLLAPGIAAPRLSTGSRVWEGFELTLTVRALPYTDGRAGRFLCDAVKLAYVDGSATVTSEVLRGVPVAAMVRELARLVWFYVPDTDDPEAPGPAWRMTGVVRKDLRDQGPTQAALEWVAKVYRLAVVLGDPPTQAVENELGLARSTAGRWVTLARREGYLAASEGPGKAGG